ncbi:thiosulfate oxidation carrier complex protein SoxZ [Aquabacterium sp. OR-4]|uniref:thiosulfate oxidation carrier complex protein SoxZ n=1 Tax=Aquabacterium sp. OR-4 TaxID=2978127 RepID=UPI0021B2A8C2|nr:thiosulfate oxidation carrier complex protein SoxZ [Aquabacterium sp. OR-4]MDT7833966.1 thiosulfate oxidation carrier complex protein SoxZ [Aquabacterium sp. OR-4]
MTDPTLIRARSTGDKTVVRVLMAHEMETGQRKDATGRLVPAWHIREISVTLNGRQVLTAQCGPSVARNPFLQFTLRGAKPGDRIGVSWVDNRGERRSDEAAVIAG